MSVELPAIPVQRLLVTGGRDFTDGHYIWRWLSTLHARYGFALLIHGGSRGVDILSDAWARGHGVQPVQCDALWAYYRARGCSQVAGPSRNSLMLLLQPQLVLAFPGGTGTADMIAKTMDARIDLINLADDYLRERRQ